MGTIFFFAVLLCLAAMVACAIRRSRDNPYNVFTRALFRIKSVRFFPAMSFAYALYMTVAASFFLVFADKAIGYERWLHEDGLVTRMTAERSTQEGDGYDFPLIAYKGNEGINKERRNILVVGDSFVWGHGSSNINQVWWNILSLELEQRGYDCTVYAVGKPGASTYDEFSWLKYSATIKEIQPDLIILGYYPNDPDLQSLGMEPKTYYPALFSNNDNRQGLRALYPNLYYFFDFKWFEKVSYTENRYNNDVYGYSALTMMYKYTESPHIEAYNTHVVQPLGSIAQELGIPMTAILTLSIPSPDSVDWDISELHLENIMPLFEQAGIPTYSPLNEYRDFMSNEGYYKYSVVSSVNRHCGPASSAFLGRYAADVLEQNYASILGPKRFRDKSKLTIEVNDWLPPMLAPQNIQESASGSQYTIEFPDQRQEDSGNFLTYSMTNKVGKHVKLNFKYPVRLSSLKIEGEDLLSAKVWILAINEELGFDDQKPHNLGKRKGSQCTWEDGSGRYITSLLLSANIKDGKQASLTLTIESDGGEEAFY